MCGQVLDAATMHDTASEERIFVTRKTYLGFLSTTSKRWSVQPSVKIVGMASSSATGASATVSPADITPVNQSISSESFSLRSSLTLPSTPAASSAVMVAILRAQRNPPSALISSAARVCPFSAGAPRYAPGPDKKVIWPTLNGVLGIFPFAVTATPAARGAATQAPAPSVAAIPKLPMKRRRSIRSFMSVAPLCWQHTDKFAVEAGEWQRAQLEPLSGRAWQR